MSENPGKWNKQYFNIFRNDQQYALCITMFHISDLSQYTILLRSKHLMCREI